VLAPDPTAAALSEEDLADHAGRYPLMSGFVLTIRVKAGQLQAQATGLGAFPLKYSGNDHFSTAALEVEIKFNRDPEGQVKSLTLYQGGQMLSGNRE